MKFILIVFLNATTLQVPSANVAPAVMMSMVTFETEEACTAGRNTVIEMMRRTQFTNSFNGQVECVPAGEKK